MAVNLDNPAVATGLEKVSFHSNSKERQCQRMFKLRTIALISHASKVRLKNAEYIMRNVGLEEAQAGIKIVGSKIHNLRYADDTTLTAEREEELKSLLMKVKEETGKVGLKLNVQKMKIMASGPITAWEIDGQTVEAVSDFIFWTPKSLQMVIAAMKLKDAYSLEGKL